MHCEVFQGLEIEYRLFFQKNFRYELPYLSNPTGLEWIHFLLNNKFNDVTYSVGFSGISYDNVCKGRSNILATTIIH